MLYASYAASALCQVRALEKSVNKSNPLSLRVFVCGWEFFGSLTIVGTNTNEKGRSLLGSEYVWVKSEKGGGVRWEGKPTPIETSKYEHDWKVGGRNARVKRGVREQWLCAKGRTDCVNCVQEKCCGEIMMINGWCVGGC